MMKENVKTLRRNGYTSKKQNGITLIALVVTIIVLLILAGISISMLTGQNGILNRAAEAKEKNADASDLEYLQTKAYEAITNYYASGSTETEMEYVLKSLNGSGVVADANTGSITYNGKTYDISDVMGKSAEQKAIEAQTDVKLKQITKNNATGDDVALFETGKVRMIIEEEGDSTNRAVIPNGFYYVTGAPSTGLVVSDKFGDDDNNVKGGNQFVWVPCKGTAGVIYEKTADSSTKYGLASSWEKYKSHQYYYTDYKDWTDYGGDLDSVNKYGGFYIARYEAGVPSDATFYANRDGATYVTEKDANVLNNGYKPVSKKNNQAWNYVYQRTAKALGQKMYEGHSAVTSQLVDSYAWDTAVDWLAKEVSGIGDNSTGYGNYYNSGIKFLDSLYAVHQYNNGWTVSSTYKKGSGTASGYTELATGVTALEGSSSQNNVKNIYDMAGNMWEWTTEVGNHSGTEALLTEEQATAATYAVLRGGSFNYYGSVDTVSRRNGSNSASSARSFNIGFRVVLYIQK